MTESVTGTVAIKSVKGEGTEKRRYGLKVDNDWFNAFGSTDISEGDQVSIEYSTNDYGNQIEEIDVIEEASEDEGTRKTSDSGKSFEGTRGSDSVPVKSSLSKQENIRLQVAFKKAVETVLHEDEQMDSELSSGEKIQAVEEYTNGFRNLLQRQSEVMRGDDQ